MKNFTGSLTLLFVISLNLWIGTFSSSAQVSFTVSPTNGCDSLVAVFTNTSTPPANSFKWHFGNGDTSTLVNPTYTYRTPGYFCAWLEAWDTTGGGSIYMGMFSMNPPCLNVYANPDTFNTSTGLTACPGEQITFWFNGNYNTIRWNFGDGSQEQYWNWVNHTYNNPGAYQVRMIINTQNCGTDTVFATMVISNGAIPYPQINYNQSPVCSNDAVYFSQPSCNAISYLWNFGDATTSTLCEPQHAYGATGTYEVILTTTNVCGNSNNDTVQIIVSNSVTADANFYYWNQSCPFDPVDFTANNSGTYNWSFGDGYTSTLRDPKHFYTDTGNYQVQLILSNGCGSSDTNIQIVNVQYNANNKPNASFEFQGFGWPSPDTIMICPGEPVEMRDNSYGNGSLTLLWTFGDGDSSTAGNPVHAFAAPGTYAIQLFVENSCQGHDTAIKWVVVSAATPPNAELNVFSSPGNIACPGDRYFFFEDINVEGSFIYTYSVWFGNGDSSVNITQPPFPGSSVAAIYSYPDTGIFIYTFTVTNSCGNTDTLQDTVFIIDPNPAPFFFAGHKGGDNDESCPGDSVEFMAMGGVSYLWQFPGGATDINNFTLYAFDSAGQYIVNCIITNGCGVTDTIIDTVLIGYVNKPSPWFNISDNLICGNDTVFFSYDNWSSGSKTYYWDFGDGTFSTLEDPFHVYTSGGVYSVFLAVTNGCGTSVGNDPQEIMVDMPLVDFSGLGTQYCMDASSITLSGSPAGGAFSGPGITGNNFDPSAAGDGTHNISYTYTNSRGCPVTEVKATTVNPLPPADAGLNVNICSGDSAQLNASGGVSYSWSPSSGLSVTTISNPRAAPPATTEYFVTVTSAPGCTSSDSVIVSVVASLTAIAGTDTGVCPGGSVMLNGQGGGSYLWYPSTGLDNPNIPNPNATPTAPTVYHLVVSSGGCSDTDSVVVAIYPIPGIALDSLFYVACYGDNTGRIFITPFGTGPFQYNWSNSDVTEDILNLVQGDYTVTVTDGKGCTHSITTLVTQPGPLGLMLSETDVSCNGLCDGAVSVSIWGGMPGYAVLWSSGCIDTICNNLCAGDDTVTVTDANGCMITGNIFINEPTALNISMTKTDITCYGLCNGSIEVNASGGMPAYSYYWSAACTAASCTGLCTGTYTVTVADSNGCADSITVLITEPTALSLAITKTDVSCNGLCNGSASVAVSGGIPGYSYNWSTLCNTPSCTGLCAGTYTVTVADTNGCSDSITVLINEPTALNVTMSKTDVSCNGLCDGTASAAVSGGTLPYTYLWNDPAPAQIASIATGLCSGTYTVTVTDAKGCTATGSISITQPTALSVNMTKTDASCNGLCNGTATGTATEGTPPYTYMWDDPLAQTSSTATGLCSTTYKITVTDSKGCTATGSVTINEPSLLSVSTPVTNVSCFNQCNGTMTATPTGGTTPYSYNWSTGATGNPSTVTGLCTGTYFVTVTDAKGCTASGSGTVTEPPALTYTIAATGAQCNGSCDGTASITVNGGTPAYTYVWNDLLAQTTSTATGLCAGNYNVTVTDGNGCAVSASVSVTEPLAMTITFSVTDANCNGSCDGQATAAPNNGTGSYTFIWSNAATTQSIAGLCAGNYSVTVADANSCSAISSVTINEPASLSIVVDSVLNVSCAGGSDGGIYTTTTGGIAPYTWLWSCGCPPEDLLGRTAGTYTVTVTDANGCTAITSGVITEPSPLSITLGKSDASCGSNDGKAWVVVTGGAPPYNYLWSDPLLQTTDTAFNLGAGNYSVTVTDANNCTKSANINVANAGAASITVDSVLQVTCYGGNNGAIYITVTGSSPFTYDWSNSVTFEDNTGLTAGNYNLTVTDNNGCISYGGASVSEPPALVTNPTFGYVTCSGGNNGWAETGIAGGTPPYAYQWDDPLAQVTDTASGLIAGTYKMTVTDNFGCIITDSVTVTEASALTATTSVTDATCNGTSDGTVDLTINGGTGAYSFLWSDSSITEDISGLTAGGYDLTVTDANGCTLTVSATVNEPAVLTVSVITTDANCYGSCDGIADANASGGTPLYNYAWSNGASAANVLGLCADTFAVTVTDANLCTTTATVTINEPAALYFSSIVTDATCSGVCDGTADAGVSGGTSPYSYAWSNSATDAITAGLCAGNFTVTVTDANLCTATSGLTVNEPAALSAAITGTDVTCNGGNDGSTDLTATGGSGNFAYTWSDNSTSEDLSGITAGTYNVTVVDGTCNDTVTGAVSIAEPPAVTLSVGTTDATCGSSDGSAWTGASGGTGPLSYQWDANAGNQTTDTVNSLLAGNYGVTVTDASGCTGTGYALVNNPGAPVVTVDSTNDVSCNSAADGTVYITATGIGTLAYAWSNATASEDATGLSGGTYFISVTDSVGCITINSATVYEPAVLAANAAATDASCNLACDAQANVSVTGGTPPYSYMWSNALPCMAPVCPNFCAGIYTVTLTDANGCIAIDSVTVNEPSAIVLSSTTVFPLCNGDSTGLVDLTVSGGAGGYTYLWSDSAITEDISNLTADVYGVTVTDGTGCTSTSSVSVTEPSAVSIQQAYFDAACNGACDGFAVISPAGGTPPYNVLWNTGDIDTLILGLCPGIYDVVVTDANGCTGTGSGTIGEPTALTASATTTDALCNGQCDGTITVTGSGGTPPYTGDGTNIGYCAGNYNLMVTDANGCTANVSATVNEPTAVNIDSLTSTKESGPAMFDGTASAWVNPASGTPPYVYLWNDPMAQTVQTATALGTGTYCVTVTDANGCTDTGCVLVDIISNNITGVLNGNLIVFPNPAKDVIEITFRLPSGKNAEGKIKIFDANGKMVREYILTGEKIAIADLPGGMYGIKLEADGILAGFRKVVLVK